MVGLSAATGCTERCTGPGTCPAGKVCQEGSCVEPEPAITDAGTPRDASAIIDTGERRDAGRPTPSDAAVVDLGLPSNRDAGSRPDRGVMLDTGPSGPPGLGEACDIPNFELGELDPCGTEDPNLFCLASLNGEQAYCSIACTIEELNPHHGGIDVGYHEHPPPCEGMGCCLPAEPGRDAAAPGVPIDRLCRFANDCR